MIYLYIQYLKEKFSDLKDLSTSFIIDCGNGAAGTVLPELIKAFKWPNCSLLYPEVDGTYPHHEADPTVLENMLDLQKEIKQQNVELGIGLDGDCDRMAPMTKEGKLIPGDALLSLFAADVLENNPAASIVFDIKCSSALVEVIKDKGGKPIMAPSGHSIIKSYMKSEKALLGGELSCHFFFKDSYFGYDDGIYSMLRLLRLLKTSGQSLTELLTIFPERSTTPELRLDCSSALQTTILTTLKDFFATYPQAQLSTLDGVRITLPSGWMLVRGSNTQPVLCIRVEAQDKASLSSMGCLLATLLEPFIATTKMRVACNG